MNLTQNEKVKIELKARNTQENKNNFFLEMGKVERLYKKIYLNS